RGDLSEALEHAAAARSALGSFGFKHRSQHDIPLTQLDVELCLAHGKPGDALAAVTAITGRLDLGEDARYAWPLPAAAARAAAAAAGAGAVSGGGQPADVLQRLRALAAQMPAFGPVQRANRLTFSAEALCAAAVAEPGQGQSEAGGGKVLAAFDAAAAAWERVGDPYPHAVTLLHGAEAALAAGNRDPAAGRLPPPSD